MTSLLGTGKTITLLTVYGTTTYALDIYVAIDHAFPCRYATFSCMEIFSLGAEGTRGGIKVSLFYCLFLSDSGGAWVKPRIVAYFALTPELLIYNIYSYNQ